MTTQTITPAADGTGPSGARRARPVPQVPVRPLATGVANVATIAGATLAHVAGPVGVAVTAASAAGIAGAGMATRARVNRRATGSVWRWERTRSSGPLFGGGRRGGPLFRGRGGSMLGGGLSWPNLGGSSGTKARTAAEGPRAGRSLRKHRKDPGRTSGTVRAGGPRLPAALRRRVGRRNADRGSTARPDRRAAGPRLEQAVRAATRPTGDRPPTGRQAAAAARRAITGAAPLTRRGFVRRYAAGLAAGWVAGTVTWWRNRRRKAQAKTREAKAKRAGQRRNGKVATQVRGQQPTQATGPSPAPTPIRRRTTMAAGQPTPHTGGPMSRQMLDLSEEFYAAALRDRPEGMLQVVAAAHRLGPTSENFAKAMRVGYDRAMEYPLHAAVKEMYEALAAAQLAVVKAAEQIGPAIERLHRKRLEELRNPTVGGDQSMWDVTKNRSAA